MVVETIDVHVKMCVYLICLYTVHFDHGSLPCSFLVIIPDLTGEYLKTYLSTLDMSFCLLKAFACPTLGDFVDGIAGTEAATTKRPGGQEGVIEIQGKTLLHAKTLFKISRCRTLESSILHVVHLLSCSIYETFFGRSFVSLEDANISEQEKHNCNGSCSCNGWFDGCC